MHLESEEIEDIVVDNEIDELPIEGVDRVVSGRKGRQVVTRNMIECFLNLKNSEMAFKDMIPILNVSISTIKRLYSRYLDGEFNDLSRFRTAGEKKSCSLKDRSFEKNIIASEIAINPRIDLKTLSETLSGLNNSGTYSTPTVCRILKDMNYTRKALTLVPINRNSNANKQARAQYAASANLLLDNQLIFIDETGFNLHSYKKKDIPLKTQNSLSMFRIQKELIYLYCVQLLILACLILRLKLERLKLKIF